MSNFREAQASGIIGPSYLRPDLSPYDTNLFLDTDLGYHILSTESEWLKRSDLTPAPWHQAGAYAHLDFVNDRYMLEGAAATLADFTAADLTGRISASGLSFDGTQKVRLLDSIGAGLAANGPFSIEMEVTQAVGTANTTFFDMTRVPGSPQDRVQLMRRSTGDVSEHLRGALQLNILSGNVARDPLMLQGPDTYAATPAWLRAAVGTAITRLQDRGGCTREETTNNVLPTQLQRIFIGGAYTGSALMTGHIRQIILWDKDRTFPIDQIPLSRQNQSLDNVIFNVASPEKAHNIVFNRMRPEFPIDFEIRSGDVWDGDIAGGYAERAELTQEVHVAHGSRTWLAFSIRPLQYEVNSDYLIVGQMHGGPGQVFGGEERHPWFSLRFLEQGVAQVDARYVNISSDPEVIVAQTNFNMQMGEWHDFVFEFETGTAGIFRVWHRGVQLVDYSGPVGLLDETDAGYWRFGIYRHEDPTNTVKVRHANVRIGTTNLSAKIATPDPILGE